MPQQQTIREQATSQLQQLLDDETALSALCKTAGSDYQEQRLRIQRELARRKSLLSRGRRATIAALCEWHSAAGEIKGELDPRVVVEKTRELAMAPVNNGALAEARVNPRAVRQEIAKITKRESAKAQKRKDRMDRKLLKLRNPHLRLKRIDPIEAARWELSRVVNLHLSKSKADAKRRSTLGQRVLDEVRTGVKIESIVVDHSQRREAARKKALAEGKDPWTANALARKAGGSRPQIYRWVKKARQEGKLPPKGRGTN